jgi:hypothetical protein
MKAYQTITEAIEAALELVIIMAHIEQAVASGDLSNEEAEQIKYKHCARWTWRNPAGMRKGTQTSKGQ